MTTPRLGTLAARLDWLAVECRLRDENAARVLLAWVEQQLSGREPADAWRTVTVETPCLVCEQSGTWDSTGICPVCRPEVPDLLIVSVLQPGHYLLACRDGLRVGYRQAVLYRRFVGLRGVAIWTQSTTEAQDLRQILPPKDGMETILEVRLHDILWVAGVVEVAPELRMRAGA
jgi:hypothetical protein